MYLQHSSGTSWPGESLIQYFFVMANMMHLHLSHCLHNYLTDFITFVRRKLSSHTIQQTCESRLVVNPDIQEVIQNHSQIKICQSSHLLKAYFKNILRHLSHIHIHWTISKQIILRQHWFILLKRSTFSSTAWSVWCTVTRWWRHELLEFSHTRVIRVGKLSRSPPMDEGWHRARIWFHNMTQKKWNVTHEECWELWGG